MLDVNELLMNESEYLNHESGSRGSEDIVPVVSGIIKDYSGKYGFFINAAVKAGMKHRPSVGDVRFATMSACHHVESLIRVYIAMENGRYGSVPPEAFIDTVFENDVVGSELRKRFMVGWDNFIGNVVSGGDTSRETIEGALVPMLENMFVSIYMSHAAESVMAGNQ